MDISIKTQQDTCRHICKQSTFSRGFPPADFAERKCTERCNMSVAFQECWYDCSTIKYTADPLERECIVKCLQTHPKRQGFFKN